MTRKQEGSEVSRDALESFIWKATGWRGDATVIDSILDRVDDYTQAQCSRVVVRGTPVVDVKGYTDYIRTLESEVAQERSVKDSALATVTDLTRRLVAATEALVSEACVPEPVAPPAPLVERIRVGELLDLLTMAADQATAGVSAAARVVDAVNTISNALRAADGMVKDIELSAPEPVAEPTREEAFDAEVKARISAAQTRYQAERERISQDMRTFPAEREGTPADLLEQIGHARANGDFQERLTHSQEQNVRALERLADDGESLGPDDPDESMGSVLPVAAAVEVLPGAPDPIVALVAEVEVEMAAETAAEAETAPERTPVDPDDPGDKQCSKCGEVKSREAFYRDKQAADGYKGSCKECDVKRIRERREAQRSAVGETV